MRNIATCYSEHAIQVSDSYCSGPSNQPLLAPRPRLILPIRDAVTSIYRAKLSTKKQLLIKLSWFSFTGQAFSISISHASSSPFKVHPTSRRFKKPKGVQKFEFHNSLVELLWDFTAAKYEAGPEPVNGFFLIVLIDSELSLYLGDGDEEIERKKLSPGFKVGNFSLLSRIEYISGGVTAYSTKAQFCDSGMWHEIVIKCCVEEKAIEETTLSVCIDNRNVIQVKRLRWNFRGNQAIFVDGMLVDVMWDVHDWFFSRASGYGVFLLRTRSGLDSRLWFEEKNLEEELEKVRFSLLICACKSLN